MDNEIIWQHTEVVKGSKRTVSTHGKRRSVANLKLTQEQEQASKDISAGYYALTKGGGYALLGIKTAQILKEIRGVADPEAVVDRIRFYTGRLHEWQFECPKAMRKTVEAIETTENTIKMYADMIDVDQRRVSDWYKGGLDKYAELFYRRT